MVVVPWQIEMGVLLCTGIVSFFKKIKIGKKIQEKYYHVQYVHYIHCLSRIIYNLLY